jgi:hypothetical protein
MSRVFQAHKSAEEYVVQLPYQRSQFLGSKNLSNLFSYILSYCYAFAKEERGVSSITLFEYEIVRCCKYMLKYGIYTHRDNQLCIDNLVEFFKFITYILDVFINRKDFEIMQNLDTIIHKDQIIDDYTQNNPIQKAVFDLKYRLLNKRDWSNTMKDEGNTLESYRMKGIHQKIMMEIIETLHFIIDLRQFSLMCNIVEYFHNSIYPNNNLDYFKSLSEKEKATLVDTIVNNYK